MRQKAHHRRHKQNCWKRHTRLCCTTECPHKQAMNGICGTSTVKNPVVAQRRARQQPGPELDANMNLHNRDIDHEEVLQLQNLRNCNCGSSTVSSTTASRNCTACKPNIDHLVNVLQLRNLYVSEQSEHSHVVCTPTGVSTPSQNCTMEAQIV